MHILIAPDSFKETLSAVEAAEAMAEGVRRAVAEVEETRGGRSGTGVGTPGHAASSSNLTIDVCPIADGGEGTLDALANTPGAVMRHADVRGPRGAIRTARWLHLADGTGIIEMAEAAGFHLVPRPDRNPRWTTTAGVGQLMLAARDAGCRRIIVTLGGSATCDGGLGMAQSLGAVIELAPRFASQPVAPATRPGHLATTDGDPSALGASRLAEAEVLVGDELLRLLRVDASPARAALAGVEVIAASDVSNPLFGPEGAAFVFAPQKGATPADVDRLDAGLRRLAACLPEVDSDVPGSGAAGGLGFGLRAFANARIRPGIELVLDAIAFNDRAARADLVITGEGAFDRQSLRGKAAVGVARRLQLLAAAGGDDAGRASARPQRVLVAGRVADDAVAEATGLFDAVTSVVRHAPSIEAALGEPSVWLAEATKRAVAAILATR